jgi:hypothetical protein
VVINARLLCLIHHVLQRSTSAQVASDLERSEALIESVYRTDSFVWCHGWQVLEYIRFSNLVKARVVLLRWGTGELIGRSGVRVCPVN